MKILCRFSLMAILLLLGMTGLGICQAKTVLVVTGVGRDIQQYVLLIRLDYLLGRDGLDDKLVYPVARSKNSMRFTVDSLPEFFYFNLVDKTSKRPLYRYPILMAAGDSIAIKVNNDTSWVSGRGAAKIRCAMELVNLERKAQVSGAHTAAAYFSPEYLNYIYKIYPDSLQHVADMILNNYRWIVEEKALRLLWADFYGRTQLEKFNSLNFHFRLGLNRLSSVQVGYLSTFIQTIIAKEYVDTGQQDLLARSLFYTNYIFQRTRLIHSVEQNLVNTAPGLWDRLKSGYSNPLKEKLLTTYLLFCTSSHEGDTLRYYLEAAFEEIHNQNYLHVLAELNLRRVAGSKAYPFSFKDSTGSTWALKDFKGKLVVLDFWFNGCAGCIGLKKEMAPLYEEFSQNPRVVFVSIGVDNTKQQWLKGLRSGLYTHRGQVNLYVGKEELSGSVVSPIEAYYGIRSFPQLFLIGPDGKLITADVSRPVNKEKVETIIRSNIGGY